MGTGPIPPPAQNPSPPQGDAPIIVIPDPPEVLTGNSCQLKTASPILIARAFYKRPRALTAYVGIPYDGSDASFVRSCVTNFGGVSHEVCVLAEIKWGMAGLTFYANFNVPIGQIVQIPLVAQSVDITARFIKVLLAGLSPFTYGLSTFAIPNIMVCDNPSNIQSVLLSAACVEGHTGKGNAERKAWMTLGAAEVASYFVPPFATSFRVIGNSSIVYRQSVNTADMTDIPTNATNLVPPQGVSIPIANSANFIIITNTGVAASSFELAFQIGFGGDTP